MVNTRKIDEKFTELAFTMTDNLGKWYSTVISLFALLIWIMAGPFMGWSDTWQLMANTPTTWLELFIGFWILAASNRIEARNHELINRLNDTLIQVKNIADMIAQNQRIEEEEIHELLSDVVFKNI